MLEMHSHALKRQLRLLISLVSSGAWTNRDMTNEGKRARDTYRLTRAVLEESTGSQEIERFHVKLSFTLSHPSLYRQHYHVRLYVTIVIVELHNYRKSQELASQ